MNTIICVRATRGSLQRRYMSTFADIEEVHRQACAANNPTYPDPKTGYTVFTARHHQERGKCCGNACRHCPFGHMKVKGNHICQPETCPHSLVASRNTEL